MKSFRPLILLVLLVLSVHPAAAGPDRVWRMAFGSCCRADLPQPFWDPVRALRPAAWCWVGDNIYADTLDMERMRLLYDQQKAVPGYAALRGDREISVLGTWDDHDYGANDAGGEYPKRAESQRELLDFLDEPAGSPRRSREGVYAARTFASEAGAVKVLILDTRYHRDPIGSNGTILGEAQWNWLAGELTNSKAQAHIVVTSIQGVAEEHRFEKWANFPAERRRLLELIARTRAAGVILISGDRHHAEISKLSPGVGNPVGYPLYDITSSSLTHPRKAQNEPNRHRVGNPVFEKNFGLIEIDWNAGIVRFKILGADGGTLLEEQTTLAALTPQ